MFWMVRLDDVLLNIGVVNTNRFSPSAIAYQSFSSFGEILSIGIVKQLSV